MPRVLVIGAHPDDETLFAGGMIAMRVSQGDEVYLLCTTHGEGGEVGDPPVGPIEQLAEIREAELRCASAQLGIRDVFFLPFVDPHAEIGGELHPIEASMDEFASAIAEYLVRIRPDTVITHGSNGEYGHPQHIYTHQAVFEALRRVARERDFQPTEVLTWCANYWDNREDKLTNPDDPADLVVYVQPWIERKAAAADCHRSQHTMIRRNSGMEVRDALRRVESFRRWPLELILAGGSAAPVQS